MKTMKTMLVIGLGRFGRHLAFSLTDLDCQVMAIDKNEELVEEAAERVEDARIADCTDEAVLKAIDVESFDCCFVCIGQDFLAAMEITALLKEEGARRVVVKAGSECHANLLLKIGADEIIYPERDMARSSAVRYATDNTLGSFELSEEYAIFEISPPEGWLGKTVAELNVRRKYDVNVIGIRREGKVAPITSGDFVFSEGQTLLLAGEKKALLRLAERG